MRRSSKCWSPVCSASSASSPTSSAAGRSTCRGATTTLDANPALTIVASREPRVFAAHPLPPLPSRSSGELRLNPLYAQQPEGDRIHLRLQFPTQEYEEEYGACRQYLPEALTIERSTLAAIEGGVLSGELSDLVRRKVIVDLPNRYY
jgi:hypothetical protein